MSNSILIVDDEPGIRDTLRGVLEDEDLRLRQGDTELRYNRVYDE